MYYVYIIKSIMHSDQIYVGYTTDLKKRLETHNSGGSVYTATAGILSMRFMPTNTMNGRIKVKIESEMTDVDQ